MSDDETYELPLQDQRVFGAGIRRKRVQFVPSSQPILNQEGASGRASIADTYLNLVLPGSKQQQDNGHEQDDASGVVPSASKMPACLCKVCHLPLPFDTASNISDSNPTDFNHDHATSDTEKQIHIKSRAPHEASIAHQVCAQHSHPPSHIDRKRKGLHYLQSHGFDPDARKGLGAQGQGIQYPIKVQCKDEKLGIGAAMPEGIQKNEKVHGLDAKRTRRLQASDKRKMEELRDIFYGNEDVERYLRNQ